MSYSKALFFDIDGTTIYTNVSDKENCILADKRINNASYTSPLILGLMKELQSKGVLLVPTTARTLEQTTRVLFVNELNIPYLITHNGSAIYIKNGDSYQEDLEWKSIIDKDKLLIKDFLFNVVEATTNLNFCGLKSIKIYNDSYILALFEKDSIALEYYDKIAALVLEQGNCLFDDRNCLKLVGKRIYILPKTINKKFALEFFCDKYMSNPRLTYGFGDSSIDLDFIDSCKFKFGHNLSINGDNATVTHLKAELGGIEILENINNLI